MDDTGIDLKDREHKKLPVLSKVSPRDTLRHSLLFCGKGFLAITALLLI